MTGAVSTRSSAAITMSSARLTASCVLEWWGGRTSEKGLVGQRYRLEAGAGDAG
jgi:hypothetical protein